MPVPDFGVIGVDTGHPDDAYAIPICAAYDALTPVGGVVPSTVP